MFKSTKSFGYDVRKANARLSNTTIRDLLGNEVYAEAALVFLKDTKVGMIKEGALEKY